MVSTAGAGLQEMVSTAGVGLQEVVKPGPAAHLVDLLHHLAVRRCQRSRLSCELHVKVAGVSWRFLRWQGRSTSREVNL